MAQELKPSISVLIIAHNEERNIARCIESILDQSRSADEIVLVVHNSTDSTYRIAESYPIQTISYSGPEGITYARLRGLQEVSQDVVLCIDGDSFAASNWTQEMADALGRRGNRLVGSKVNWRGNLYARLFNMHRYIGPKYDKDAASWIWGPSMGFWSKDIKLVQEIFRRSITLSEEIKLTRNPDDYWVALFMSQRGSIEFTKETSVTTYTKERNLAAGIRRNIENVSNGKKILRYFESLPELTT